MSKNSLTRYYDEVGKYPLITVEEEKRLASLINRGGKKGLEAQQKLVNSNLRLVIKIAQGFQKCGLDMEDLIQEGNTGLFTASKKFDPNKGAKFSTYASFWIKQTIIRGIENKGRTVRLPTSASVLYLKILKFGRAFEEGNNRQPTVEEIADEFGITVKKVTNVVKAGRTPVSLDAPIGEDEDADRYIVTADTGAESTPAVKVCENDTNEFLERFLNKLTEREKHILVHRFGLEDEDTETLEKIGKEHGVTRERIRQVQEIALFKMKNMMIEYENSGEEIDF